MKKRFLFFVLTITLLTLGSCKKWFTCTCATSGGAVMWQGQVEGTSKTQVQNSLSKSGGDCALEVVTCN